MYERTTFAPILLTNIASALWHGLYPGFTLAFVSFGLFNIASRFVRRNIRHYFLASREKKLVYDVVGIVCSKALIYYYFIPYSYLDMRRIWKIWKSTYFAGYIAIAPFVVLFVVDALFVRRRNEKKEN